MVGAEITYVSSEDVLATTVTVWSWDTCWKPAYWSEWFPYSESDTQFA